MESTTASDNARSHLLQQTCSAVTKYRGWVAVCDLHLHHGGNHAATMPDTSTYEWRDEAW